MQVPLLKVSVESTWQFFSIDLVDELGVNFDKLHVEDQDTYEEICEILGTKAYKIYSNAFPDFDPDIQEVV